MLSVINLILFINSFYIVVNSDNSCTQEGAVTTGLSTVFKCQNGFQTPIGCVTSGGLSVRIGETAPRGNIISECRKKDDDSAQLVPVSCEIDGKNLKPNDVYANKDYYFVCTSKADGNLSLEATGCVNSAGEKISFGGIVKKGNNYLFKCTGNSTKVRLEPYKCLHNGKEYDIGDVITDDGAFWSTCEKGIEGSSMQITLKGCLDKQGQKVNVGQRFKASDFVYICEKSGNSLSRKTVACLEVKPGNVTLEHAPGEQWLEPTTNNRFPSTVTVKYQLECYQQGDKVGKRGSRCYFEIKSGGQGIYVDPGCMKKVGRRLMTCPSTDSSLQANYIENASNKDINNAKNDGLNTC